LLRRVAWSGFGHAKPRNGTDILSQLSLVTKPSKWEDVASDLGLEESYTGMQFPALYNGCDVQMADSEYEWDIPMDANTLKRGVPVACFLRIRTWEFTTREGK